MAEIPQNEIHKLLRVPWVGSRWVWNDVPRSKRYTST